MHNDGRASFASQLAALRSRAGLSLAGLGTAAHVARGYVHHIEHGRRWPTQRVAKALDKALDAGGALLAAWKAAGEVPRARSTGSDDEVATELLELAARAEASDIGPTTLDLVDLSVDRLARAYNPYPTRRATARRAHPGPSGRFPAGRPGHPRPTPPPARRRRVAGAARGHIACRSRAVGRGRHSADRRRVTWSGDRLRRDRRVGARDRHLDRACRPGLATCRGAGRGWGGACSVGQLRRGAVGRPVCAQRLASATVRRCGQRCSNARPRWINSRGTARPITTSTSTAANLSYTREPRWHGWATRPRRNTAWRADELTAAVNEYRGVPEVEALCELSATQHRRTRERRSELSRGEGRPGRTGGEGGRLRLSAARAATGASAPYCLRC